MKSILLLILIFINKYAYSAEWISEATAKVTILKKIISDQRIEVNFSQRLSFEAHISTPKGKVVLE